MTDVNALRGRWKTLMTRCGAKGGGLLFLEIVQAYSQPHRRYHDLRHLVAVLAAFDRAKDLADDPEAVELALWFHDVVYQPGTPGNEEASAARAAEALAEAGLPAWFGARVADLVLASRHEAEPRTPDERLLVDCDLSILGADAAAFDAYERDVREEYAGVPEEPYRAGRAAILEGFLARPRIYSTPAFAALEAPARENLARSIVRLRA